VTILENQFIYKGFFTRKVSSDSIGQARKKSLIIAQPYSGYSDAAINAM
jgi:hypothetical protein